MPQISLVQRTKCFACELWDDKPRLWFTLSFLLSVGGTCFTLGGLAALTAYCWDHQPLGLAAGFKLEPVRGAGGGGWVGSELARVCMLGVQACGAGGACGRRPGARLCLQLPRALSHTNYTLPPFPSPLPTHLPTQPYTSKTNEVMRIEKAVVTSTTGTFQCDKYFRCVAAAGVAPRT